MNKPSSLSTVLSFGKYKGNSVASVYSGGARALIKLFLELVDKSFGVIFSESSYFNKSEPNEANFYAMSGGWVDDEKKVNHHCVSWLIGSFREGGSCEYNVSPTRIQIVIILVTK